MKIGLGPNSYNIDTSQTFRNEDDGCQFVEAAVRGVHFPSVRAWDNSRRRGVPAKADQLHNEAAR